MQGRKKKIKKIKIKNKINKNEEQEPVDDKMKKQ